MPDGDVKRALIDAGLILAGERVAGSAPRHREVFTYLRRKARRHAGS